MRILVFGASGMLGSTICRWFSISADHSIFPVYRSIESSFSCGFIRRERVQINENLFDENCLRRTFELVKPDLVINCVGLVKQVSSSYDPVAAIPVNSLLPLIISFCIKES